MELWFGSVCWLDFVCIYLYVVLNNTKMLVANGPDLLTVISFNKWEIQSLC